HPGEVDCYDSIGYHTIGIGAMHALSSLIANGCLCTTDIKMAIYFSRSLVAKKRRQTS
ncbi:hypothetical protein LCGC14_2715480, partial [marine sediment metagenome]